MDERADRGGGIGDRSILMLAPASSAPGPLPKIVRELDEAMRRRGATVEMLPWGSRGPDERPARRLLGRLSDALAARRSLRAHPGTVLLVQTAHNARAVPRDHVLLRLCRRYAACSALVLHGSMPELVTGTPGSLVARLTRGTFAMADAVSVSSSEEQRAWSAIAPATAVLVLRNPLPPPSTKRPPRSEREPLRILFVGRLIPSKGCMDLVLAFAEVRARRDCRLRIVGEGPQRDELVAAVAAAGLERDVEMMSGLDDASLEQEYAEAAVLALPTLNEGLPTVVLEAMARGLPVVTTGIRGCADYFCDGRDVLFVSPGAHAELAAALDRVLSDEPFRRCLAESALETMRRFEPDEVVEDYERLINEAMRVAGGRRDER